MVDDVERTRDDEQPRSATEREWEVFAREDGTLRHVGSVTAPDATVAHDEAATLFGWASEAVWLCPADETRRYASAALGARTGGDGGSAERGGAADDAHDEEAAPEPSEADA